MNMVAGWLYSLLAARRRAGGLAMDAPVLASVWNRLADGYQAFEACRCGGSALPLCIAALLLWLCAAAASAAASRCSTRLRCLRLWLKRRICPRPASRDLFSGDLFSLTESVRGWEDAPHWQRTSCFLVRAMFAHRIDILAPDSIPSRTDTSLQMSAALPAPPCSHLKGGAGAPASLNGIFNEAGFDAREELRARSRLLCCCCTRDRIDRHLLLPIRAIPYWAGPVPYWAVLVYGPILPVRKS